MNEDRKVHKNNTGGCAVERKGRRLGGHGAGYGSGGLEDGDIDNRGHDDHGINSGGDVVSNSATDGNSSTWYRYTDHAYVQEQDGDFAKRASTALACR